MKTELKRKCTDMLSKIVRTKYLSVWVIAAIDVLLSVLVSFLCLSTEKYMLGWNVSGADYAILLLASLITSALAFFACGLARKIIRYSRLKDVLAFIMASFLKAFLMLTPFYLRLNEVVDVDHMIFAMIVDAGFTFLLLMFVRSFMV